MLFNKDQLNAFATIVHQALGVSYVILELDLHNGGYWVEYGRVHPRYKCTASKTHDELCWWLNKKLKFTSLEKIIYDV